MADNIKALLARDCIGVVRILATNSEFVMDYAYDNEADAVVVGMVRGWDVSEMTVPGLYLWEGTAKKVWRELEQFEDLEFVGKVREVTGHCSPGEESELWTMKPPATDERGA